MMRILILIVGVLLLVWGLAYGEYNRGMGVVGLPDEEFVPGQIMQAVDANTAKLRAGPNNTMLIAKDEDGKLTYKNVYMDADVGTGMQGGCPEERPILDLHLNGDPEVAELFPELAQPHFFCRELDLSIDLDLGNFTFNDNQIINENGMSFSAFGGPDNATITLRAAREIGLFTESNRIVLNAAGPDVPVQFEWLRADRNRIYGDAQYGMKLWSTDNTTAEVASDEIINYGTASPGLDIQADGNIAIRAGYPVGDQRCVNNFCEGTVIVCSADSECGCNDGSPECGGSRKAEAGIVTIDGDFTATDVVIEGHWAFKDNVITGAGDSVIVATAVDSDPALSLSADQDLSLTSNNGSVRTQSTLAIGDATGFDFGQNAMIQFGPTRSAIVQSFGIPPTVFNSQGEFDIRTSLLFGLGPTFFNFNSPISANFAAPGGVALYIGHKAYASSPTLKTPQSKWQTTGTFGAFDENTVFLGDFDATSDHTSFRAQGTANIGHIDEMRGYSCANATTGAYTCQSGFCRTSGFFGVTTDVACSSNADCDATIDDRICFTVAAQTNATNTTGYRTEGTIDTAFSVATGAGVGLDIAAGVTTGVRNASRTVYTPDEETIDAASDTIPSSSSLVEITVSGGNVALTSQPSIAAGVDGQVLRIINVSSNTLTLTQGAARNIRTGQCTGVCQLGPPAKCDLGEEESVEFTYLNSVDSGTWVQTGCMAN